jgi:hypothetical protein
MKPALSKCAGHVSNIQFRRKWGSNVQTIFQMSSFFFLSLVELDASVFFLSLIQQLFRNQSNVIEMDVCAMMVAITTYHFDIIRKKASLDGVVLNLIFLQRARTSTSNCNRAPLSVCV